MPALFVGIRPDVYLADDENTVYEVEMQGSIEHCLSKGMPYGSLPKSHIIFICCFDYFGTGRHIYTFENVCLEDSGIRLGDETQRIILNTRGTMDDVDEEMKELLYYMEHSTDETAQTAGSGLVKELHEQVRKVKENRRLGVEFVTYEEHLMRERNEGKAEGREEGREEGIFLTKRVLELASQGLAVPEIAAVCDAREDEIRRILE